MSAPSIRIKLQKLSRRPTFGTLYPRSLPRSRGLDETSPIPLPQPQLHLPFSSPPLKKLFHRPFQSENAQNFRPPPPTSKMIQQNNSRRQRRATHTPKAKCKTSWTNSIPNSVVPPKPPKAPS